MNDKKGLFGKLKAGLSRTRDALSESIESVFKAFVKIDEDLFDELMEALIAADIGVNAAMQITDELRDRVKEERITDGSKVKELLKEIIAKKLEKDKRELDLSGKPAVILVIGVNGVGKTTSIGKLAAVLKNEGKKVLVAAADTFRAAAINQLQVWSERAGAEMIKGSEGADPSSVVFDACTAAKNRGADVLIIDTAGRLHNKKNLMEELKKMSRVVERELPESSRETLIVLDASTGQNANVQAQMFAETADITGIILTKLDGTAKGGVVISISQAMDIPVKFIGVGEGIDDLQAFSPDDFARALFEE